VASFSSIRNWLLKISVNPARRLMIFQILMGDSPTTVILSGDSDRQRRIPAAKIDFISLLGFFTLLRYVQNDKDREGA